MDVQTNRLRQERSPRCPSSSLPEALDWIEKIFRECGRAEVPAEVAAKCMGYSSLSGASRTALAALSYYGLLHRQGNMQKVSDLALRIIRPISDSDKLEALRLAAISPATFAELWETHHQSSETVLGSILLHRGFTEDGARKAAKAFKESMEFLETFGGVAASLNTEAAIDPVSAAKPSENPLHEDTIAPRPPTPTSKTSAPNVLATYKIPLGSNEAELVFTGKTLEPEDFDALIDYVEIFKRQFQRKQKAEASHPPEPRAPEEEESLET